MRTTLAAAAGVALLLSGPTIARQRGDDVHAPRLRAVPAAAPALTPTELTGVVQKYCVACHNDQLRTGNLSLQSFAVDKAPERAVDAEKMIAKLRAGMMPPPGMMRPAGDTLQQLVETLERLMDQTAARSPKDRKST